MVELTVAMRALIAFLTLLVLASLAAAPQQTTPAVRIDAPGGGEALQGVVPISGATGVENFQSAALFFAYPEDELPAETAETWFLIAENLPALDSGLLAEWNTFLITDGDYTLRLVVTLQDGSSAEAMVDRVRVRNYSPVETSTPAPTLAPSPVPTLDSTALFTPAPTSTPPGPTPTPTSLPPNPARLTPGSIQGGLLIGAGGAVLLFLLFGFYASIREALRKK